ncbi:MAG: hypothetical protein KKD33_07055 [Verrucomicrobia bacterium]|nr:hypothetical protein [Verrucomicrobiota bacterium]MBU4285757.1 hypothetical protein [Verrucomicrobiota bacterium]MBU4366073.1 hypothetical protein [Verrucomicrobiota bacterium]
MSTRQTKASDGRQIGGVFLSPNWIEKPALAKPWVRRIADMGYSSMIIFVRHQKRTVLDRRVHDAVKAVVKMGHALGLKMLLDTDHCWWGPMFAETHPDAALWAIRSAEASVRKGCFDFRVLFPRMPGQILFQEISAAFAPTRAGYRYIPSGMIAATPMHFLSPKPGIVLKGRVKGEYSGKMVFYVALKTFGVADVAHPQYLKAQEQMLDTYADIPLDGFTWDEPGKGLGDMTAFKAGAGVMSLFRKMNGYELRPNLIYLDRLDGTSKAIKVRCDFYRSLIEMNYIAQDRHNRYARKRFKREMIFGTHQTWSGFPTDLTAGMIDYFKLGKVLTAAWTDGGWDASETKYPIHNFMLAEGLKKELDKRDAYYNDWGLSMPAVGNMRFANRLKMLFHVNFFNHCICEYSEGLINYTQEPVRSAAERDTRNLDRFDRLVTDEFAPHTDVAYLYTWETMAATPKWMTRMFYTNIANLSLHLTDKGLYAAMMSGENLLRAKIGKGCFTINGFTYRVLLMPYINVIKEPVYRKAMQICAAGVPVIVVGPPPEFSAEAGKLIRDDFAGKVGIRPFSLHDYMSAYAEHSSIPGINEWEPSWVDATYPAEVTTGRKAMDQEGSLMYVKSASLPLYYMPEADPREDLTRLVASLVQPRVETFAEDAYYRIFTERKNAGSDRLVLVSVAKGHVASYALAPDRFGGALRPPVKLHEMKTLFRLAGGDLVMKGGTWGAVKLERGKVTGAIGDCAQIVWKGRPVRMEKR